MDTTNPSSDSFKIVAVELSLFADPPPQSSETSVFARLADALKITELIRITPPASEDLLPQIYRETEGYDFLMIGHSDSDFYNAEENRKLLEKILHYDVDIGFGDNYPAGMIAEFFRRETFPVMENIRKQNRIPIQRDVFAKIIAVDYNTFDLENHYAEIGLRTLRLSFYSDNLQDRITNASVKGFFPEGERDFLNCDYPRFAETVLKNRHRLRTHPRYYEIAITHRAVQSNSYLPDQNEEHDLSEGDLQIMLDKIIPFAGKPVISLSGFGEMTAHPQWQKLVEEVLAKGQECILETAGVYWEKSVSDYWLGHPRRDLLTVIFKVEAVDPELYKKIRGKNFPLAAVLDNIEYYLLRNPERSYVETVKTMETFKHLPTFHDYFSRYTKNIIIGKYNPYRGAIPELRVKPMKPYEQIDCWHLKRDMKIDARGEVWLCKQDFNREHSLGNLIREPIAEIHERGQAYFERHVAGWEFCQGCDEHYTFNF